MMRSIKDWLLGEYEREKGAFLWVVLAVTIVTLPNLIAIIWPGFQVGRVTTALHGAALLMLPGVLGLGVRRWLRWCLPLVVLMPCVASYYVMMKNPPREWAVLVLLETNPAEILRFGTSIAAAAVMVPLLGLGYWKIVNRIRHDYRLGRLGLGVMAGLLVLIPAKDMLVQGSAWGMRTSRNRLLDLYPSGMMVAAWNGWGLRRQISARQNVAGSVEAKQKTPARDRREIHLLVLGESARYASFQLNGYERETTPLLIKQPGLINLRDVVAPATITLQSVPLILTGAAPSELAQATSLPSVLSIYKKAGFAVHWLSTQRKHGMWDTTCSIFSNDADTSKFLSGNLAEGNSFYTSALDTELLPEVRALLARGEQRVFIVLHTMGSHFRYTDRYPASAARFEANPEICAQAIRMGVTTPEQKKHMTNAYDNTVLFTDSVLAQLIEILSSEGAVASLLFTSDHGENSADAPMLPCGHGIPTVDVLHVPTMVWLSPAYRELRPEKARILESHAGAPLGPEAIFHTGIDLADIECPLLRTDRSAASNALTTMPRKAVTLDGDIVDFDADVTPAEKRGGWRPLKPGAPPRNAP